MKKLLLLSTLTVCTLVTSACDKILTNLIADTISTITANSKVFTQISSKTTGDDSYSINLSNVKVTNVIGNGDELISQNETVDFSLSFAFNKMVTVKSSSTPTSAPTTSDLQDVFSIEATDSKVTSFKVKVTNDSSSLVSFDSQSFSLTAGSTMQSPKIRAVVKSVGQVTKNAPFTIQITDNNGTTTTIKAELIISPINNHFAIDTWNIDDYYGNGDAIANRGEKLRVYPVLRNSGTADSNNITATIKFKEHTLVNFSEMQKTFNYQKIKSFSSSKKFGSPINIDIDKKIAPETSLPVTLEIKDDFGNKWTEDDELKIEKIANNLSIKVVSYLDETGNKDFLPNKGERVRLKVVVENKGSSPTNELKIDVKSLKNKEPIFSKATFDVARFGGNMESKTSTDYAVFKINADALVGDSYPISLRIYDDFNNYWDDLKLITVFPLGNNLSITKTDIEEINSDNGKRRFRITPYFRNIGISPSDTTSISALTANEDGEVIEKRRDIFIPPIKQGEMAKASAGVVVQVDTTQKFNVSIPLIFYLEDKFGNKTQVAYKFLVP